MYRRKNRPVKKLPKRLMNFYRNGATVKVTTRTSTVEGIITGIEPVGQLATIQGDGRNFVVKLSDITGVKKV